MVSPKPESSLPRVEESDLLKCVLEDATSPDHGERWQTFARANGHLAREVLKRVHITVRASPVGTLEIQKIILDEITYVYAALAEAALRLSSEGEPPVIVGDVGEDLRPSV